MLAAQYSMYSDPYVSASFGPYADGMLAFELLLAAALTPGHKPQHRSGQAQVNPLRAIRIDSTTGMSVEVTP